MAKGYPALLCFPRSECSKDEGTTVRKGPKALLSCRLCAEEPHQETEKLPSLPLSRCSCSWCTPACARFNFTTFVFKNFLNALPHCSESSKGILKKCPCLKCRRCHRGKYPKIPAQKARCEVSGSYALQADVKSTRKASWIDPCTSLTRCSTRYCPQFGSPRAPVWLPCAPYFGLFWQRTKEEAPSTR